MDIHINNGEKTVEWNVGEKVFTIHNENLLYAFQHGKNMLMIKERFETSEIGFTTYDAEENRIFSYKYLGNSIVFREAGEARSLLIYDESGNFIAEIGAPSGYTFVSIKNNVGNIMVAAQGITDTTKDSFGRNDWNFTIDFSNFYVKKKAISQ